MKKIASLFSLTWLFPALLMAQQLPQYSQYMFNKLAMNPAVSGSEKYVDMGLSHRSQWGDFDGAPRTQIVYVHSSFNNKNYGLGGFIFNDKFGPIYNTGISLSYAYHLPVWEETYLSLGLAGSVAQFGVNGGMIKLNDESDELIDLSSNSATLVPEAATGLYLYNKSYYVGFSAMHLTQNKVAAFKNLGTNATVPFSRHYYLMGGYTFNLDDEINFLPSILVNKVANNPMQTTFTLLADFGMFQFGGAFRTDDALILLTNIKLLDYLNISYSYDLQTSRLSKYSPGSHELMIRYKIFYNPLYERMHQQQQSK